MKMFRKRINKKNMVGSKCNNTLEEESLENEQNEMLESKNLREQNSNIEVKEFPSPTFNIHIHVPCYNTSTSKIYLPRIHPEIHLHFDEIAKKLDFNKNDEILEEWLKTFQSVLPKMSPKFGDVKFHLGNKSKEKTEELSKGSETPLSTKHHKDDHHLKGNKNNKRGRCKVSKKNNTAYSCGCRKNASMKKVEHTSNYDMLSEYKDLKIKNAVVVLNDVCKSKTWKNSKFSENVDSGKLQNENNSSVDSTGQLENQIKKEITNSSVKPETESVASCFPSPVENFELDGHLEDHCDVAKSEEIIIDTSTFQESIDNNKSLTALAEGCSFSEILNRFKLKSTNCLPDSSVQSVINTKSCKSCNNEGNSDNCEPVVSSNNFEENIKVDLNSGKKINGALDNVFITKREELAADSRVSIETVEKCSAENHYCNDTVSDKISVTSEQSFGLERIKGFSEIAEILELDSSIKTNSWVNENNVEMSGKNYRSFFDNLEDVDLHSKLIKKEMKRKSQTDSKDNKKMKISKIKKKSNSDFNKSKKSPFDKRRKSKSGTPKKKKSNWPPVEDYIPLNASGPTKFAVAPLNVVNPYKFHAAKNFKQEMLFGNRVKRFSSSGELRTYQLKQMAGT